MSAIKAGDLVMVVRAMPCCGVPGSMGAVAKVIEIRRTHWCKECGAVREVDAAVLSGGRVIRVDRLIKIDQPAEMKDTETTKELTV